MKTRAVGNITGRYNFMSLETGAEINGRVIDPVPITEAVKEQVEALGQQQSQPFRASKMLIFEWRPGNPIGDGDAHVVPPPPNMILPDPVDLPNAGPNPFAPTDTQTQARADETIGLPQGQGQQEQQQQQQQQQQQGPQTQMIELVIELLDENENRNEGDKGARTDENSQNQGAQTAENAQNQGAQTTQNEEEMEETQDEDNINAPNQGANIYDSEYGNDQGADIYDSEYGKDEGANNDGDNVQESRQDEAVVHENDSEEEQDFSDEEDIPEHRKEEIERRGGHFDVDTSDNAGRGKRKTSKRSPSFMHCRKDKRKIEKERVKNVGKRNKQGKSVRARPARKPWAKHCMHDGRPPKQKAFIFLQKRFNELESEERRDFLVAAMNELQYTGRTHLMERYTNGWMFAQMSAKKGIDLYGKEAELKLMAEFTQLLEYEVFHGRKADELTSEQKKKAANMINLIEEKINQGHTKENLVIKARSVFNGRVQRGLYSKEEIASPTVSLDGFFLSSIADAIEERFIAVTNIKGAYLHAKMKDLVIMKISGPEVGIFCELDPSLKEFVVEEKGKQVLYVQLDKLLWYETYLGTLKEMGFEINPYNPCVANATIDGQQCTVCWYVDDNKISHKDKKVVENVIGKIEDKYGKMSRTEGDELNFLGMELKFGKGKLTISVKKHILKAFDIFLEEVKRNASTPARGYLFKVREESKDLDETRADNFHSVVALLLYISRRCRLDIQTAVGFLTTRVSCPDEDDWAKLKRVMEYLRGTIDLTLTIGGDSMTKMKSWVDVSYGVHSDSKSHTGGCASFRLGTVLTMCQKQKLNVKSSTEGEVVGVCDYMPNMIWGRMFLGAQGHVLEENILFHDNQSAIKLEKNGRVSSSRKTKHMDNRFFWI